MRKEALAFKNRALEMGPTQPWAYVGARIIHERLGDKDEARVYREKESELFGRPVSRMVMLVEVDPEIDIELAEEYLADADRHFPEVATTDTPVIDTQNLFPFHFYACHS